MDVGCGRREGGRVISGWGCVKGRSPGPLHHLEEAAGEVDHGHVGQRHAERHARQLALEPCEDAMGGKDDGCERRGHLLRRLSVGATHLAAPDPRPCDEAGQQGEGRRGPGVSAVRGAVLRGAGTYLAAPVDEGMMLLSAARPPRQSCRSGGKGKRDT